MDRRPQSSKPTHPRQLTLPIEATPEVLRRAGLAEAHTRPLVAWGKHAGSYRTSPAQAWSYPLVQMTPAHSWSHLTLDLDGPDALTALELALAESRLPPPSVVVTRTYSGNKQASWILRDPVHRYPKAGRRPLRLFARISEFYSARLNADPGFNAAGIQRSPLDAPHQHPLAVDGPCTVEWIARTPYPLTILNRHVPSDYRHPARPAVRSDAGRNCAAFCASMRYAGSAHNIDAPILPFVERINPEVGSDFRKGGLPTHEVRDVAKHVEQYRAEGFARPGHAGGYYDHSPARQAARGRKSGLARRSKPAYRERLGRILTRAEDGMSNRAIARELGVDDHTVAQMLTRWRDDDGGGLVRGMADAAARHRDGRPRRYEAGQEPWIAEGISRRTWYRQRSGR